MARKFFVGGNWKMNGTKSEINDIVAFLKTGPLDPNVGTSPSRSVILFFNIIHKTISHILSKIHYLTHCVCLVPEI